MAFPKTIHDPNVWVGTPNGALRLSFIAKGELVVTRSHATWKRESEGYPPNATPKKSGLIKGYTLSKRPCFFGGGWHWGGYHKVGPIITTPELKQKNIPQSPSIGAWHQDWNGPNRYW